PAMRICWPAGTTPRRPAGPCRPLTAGPRRSNTSHQRSRSRPEMTTFPAIPMSGGARRPVQVGARAARALVTELARHAGPKTGLLLGAPAGSAALAAAIDALLPDDTLTVVGNGGGDAGALREHV